MKILVVDDNAGLAAVLKLMLEDEGFDVASAKDGEDGYSEYLLFRPDIVITDIQMPVKTGIELMGLIRGHDPKVKIICMSADMSRFQSILNEEKEKHQVCLLEKPFSRDKLMELLFQFAC